MAGFGEKKKKKIIHPQSTTQERGNDLHKQAVHFHLEGDLYNAENAYRQAIETGYLHHGIFSNLGIICKNSGRIEEAIFLYKKAIKVNSSDSEAYANLGNLYQELGQLNQALASTLKSLELRPYSHATLMNLGLIYKDRGQLDQALASTLKSLDIKADNPTAYLNLGGIYQELGQLDQALTSILRSLELQPNHPGALMNLGGIYKATNKFEEANDAFMLSLESEEIPFPLLIQAFEYYDSTNQKEKLRQAILKVESHYGHSVIASSLYKSRLFYHEKLYRASLKCLLKINKQDLTSDFARSKYYFFRGLVEDKSGLYQEAFHSFSLAQEDNKYKYFTPLESLSEIASYVHLSGKLKYFSIAVSQSIKNPVFLLGFPRSGTTLLDTVLRSHPSIEVAEEKDQLNIAQQVGIVKYGKRIEDFSDLNETQLGVLRQEYWARLHQHASGSATIIIDKLPLNIVKLPLIKMLFPDAKIILAIRHPCDSVLSCFQQTFSPNTAMANFTSLAKSIYYYDKVMTAWNIYIDSFSVDCLAIKYEDLIEDFNGSMSEIISFLGVEWSETLKNYRSTALKRGAINTPSATQVTQPLYKSSIGKWKNYANYFDDYLPILNPWIKHWGYD